MKYAGPSKSDRNIGARIVKERDLRGWTQEDLSVMTKQHVAAISHWETGLRVPSVGNLIKLAHAFGLNLDDLVSTIKRQHK